MGNPKGDWAPTRDPKRNAQIARDAEKQAAIEAAYLKHLQAFRERRAHNLPGILTYINQQIPILVGAWQQQVDNAITDADYVPVESESKLYWWIALGGNLLWAATCLVNPEAALAGVLIKGMSFAGAAIGSGGIQAMGDLGPPEPKNPEDAKAMLRKKVAKARGGLETYYQEKRQDWGSRFERLQDWDQPDDALLNQFNVYIWQQMFASIPYDNDRFDRIHETAVDAVKSAVADFNRQWTKFKRDNVWLGPKELKKRNVVFRPILRIQFDGKPLGNPETIADLKFR
jgi:hypothetical protein